MPLFLALLSLSTVEICFSQVPGDKLWEVTAPLPIISSPAIAQDGTIYVGSGEQTDTPGGSLCSFSPQGTTNWILSFPRAVRSSPSIGPDGRIYVGCWNGELKIVNPTGSYSKFVTGGYIAGSPAIASDGTVYIGSVSNRFNKLFALTPDGAVKWVFSMVPVLFPDLTPNQSSSPAIGPDGTIYVGSIDQNVYAIHPDGTTNWVFPLTAMTNSVASATYASPAIGPDGTIYIGADNGIIYAIDPKGTAKWKFQISRRVESSVAVSRDGTIYFGSVWADGGFYALAPDGTQKWSFPSSGVSSSPAICSDGSIYVGSYFNNKLYALNASGSNLWTFAAPDMIFSSPTIGDDGTIYTAAGRKLYALYGTNTLMNSSWPMFRGNVKHTARDIQRGIQKPGILADGNVALNLNVETGCVYQVDYSTNLVDWTVLTNFVSETFTNQVVDTAATNSAQRFYRLGTPVQ